MNCFAQNIHLKITGGSIFEDKIIDSLNYIKKHNSVKSINKEIDFMSESLRRIGYIENITLENKKINDSNFIAKLKLGVQIKTIHIYIGQSLIPSSLFPLNNIKDTIILPYKEAVFFLEKSLARLEQNGFAMAKLKLINIKKKGKILFADLQFESDQKRLLSKIIIKHSEKNDSKNFPENFLTQINRKYHNKIFNQTMISKIHADFKKLEFIDQVKYPETLFTKDSTKVFVFLEKRKSNNFDGYIGFSNSKKNKIIFNGYLNLKLENTIHAGEKFSLLWKSDGNNQKIFKTNLEIPYIFKSPIGLKGELQIFKQDSIFQNTKSEINLSYYFNYNTRFYLGYQSTESSDIQNTNNITISNYKNYFYTTSFDFTKFDINNFTFPEKTTLNISIGFGKRVTDDLLKVAGNKNQLYVQLEASQNIYLNTKNCINIKSQNYYLQSGNYIINELYRFGGHNSIRGFTENSLQANLMSAIITEYRIIISPSFYVHSIIDYGVFKDHTSIVSKNKYEQVSSIGIGLGTQTKNGLLKIALANGNAKNQEIKFQNSIIDLNYSVKF